MYRKTPLFFKKFFCFLFLVLPLTASLYAQMTIGKPTFLSYICANSGFNSFEVQFTFNAAGVTPTNQFIVELSDPVGNFSATPTVLYTSVAGAVSSSPATLAFAVPTTTAGEGYKLRIRSTSAAFTSPVSNSFAAYYKIQDTPFSINNFVGNATYCIGGSYVLTIDNPGTGTNDSPLKYPSLTYNWFKDNGSTLPPTKLASAAAGSYTVSTPGIYYVETNYGTCTSNSYSNRVTVSASSTSGTATIISSKGNPFCAAQGATILSATAGNNYQWSNENGVMAGANSQTFSATVAGKYAVKVDFGGCQANASIDLQNVKFASSINVSDVNTIAPGESLETVVTTDALNPTFAWYLNDVVIPGAIGNTYSVTSKGSYKVVITQTSGCVSSSELPFIVNLSFDPNPFPDVADIPNIVSPNNDGVNDTWVLPQEYVSGTNTEIMVISAQGEIVFQTNDYQNNWPDNQVDFKNVTPVFYYIITTQDKKVKKGSITVFK
ncbi:gliding motility-associated C-terminal domain-containing protein [Flavobacterium frigoris]|uniref:Gliding motility-associated C-terminal domain-containing protein n=1 Tax=Flavobacterium frigoris TaxID=229204 RepID=A0A1H9CFY8_FLAFI|nr:gliding motility-associated C-terminal domain-containing protein [Flavobacterium frigoris]